MRIAVLGLGYVGSVSAAALAAREQDVIGVDTVAAKVDEVNAGRSPVLEPGLESLVRRAVSSGRLTATQDAGHAIRQSEVSLICVGTPSAPNGSLSTIAVERAVSTIGEALRSGTERHTVVVRSTILPGTSEELLIPLLEATSGRRVGRGLGYAVNPEFLREGSSLLDFENPAKTVIGASDPESEEIVGRMYAGSTGTLVGLSVRAAELAKYVDNAFHALKISFANEIGAICHAHELDSHEVMRSFFADTRLNISAAYLKPGFAFGGSCLPKDIRALIYASRRRDLELPLLESILPSNERCISRIVDTITALGRRRVGILGLSFKDNTDDLRESPFVELSERLLGKGYELRIYDPNVAMARLVGTNRAFIDERLPHLSALLAGSAEDVLRSSDVCIVGAGSPETLAALAHSNGHTIVDLVRLPDAETRRGEPGYIGVAW